MTFDLEGIMVIFTMVAIEGLLLTRSCVIMMLMHVRRYVWLMFFHELVNPSRLAYKGRCFHELWKYDMFQRGLPSWNWHISITSENTFLYRPAVMDSVSHTLLNKSKFISYQTFHQTSVGKRYRPSHYVLQARMLAQSTYHVMLMYSDAWFSRNVSSVRLACTWQWTTDTCTSCERPFLPVTRWT